MWQCKACGREFKRVNQNHNCGERDNNVNHYIASQPEHIQFLLKQVRDRLQAVLPHAQERMSWGMPTYWNERNIIHFAAYKKHIGLYPGSMAIEHFSEKLKEYKTSKGAVQFLYTMPIPLDLIAEIARWCYETRNHH